ncbi:TonB-dependent receptor [Pedosphaera parvula]|nr:TonB-dependent receptor [Pedosphaera parvula]
MNSEKRLKSFSKKTPLLLSIALAASSSLAQQSNTAATAEISTNTPTRLPVVVVTAQKEREEVLSIPVSVTPVTRETIQNADIRTVREASIYAPNTFINEFSARAVSNPFFRGIGGSPQNPAVTTFIDGVPQLNSYSANVELVDVDQVEFIRGPQGALFGRNTAGGLINITSRRPTDLWTAYADANYGNYNFRDVRGTISGPLFQDQVGLSLSGGYSARDGYTVNDFTGHRLDSREAGFGKGQLLWKINDRLDLRLILSGEHDHDGDYALGDLGFIRAHPHHVDRDFEGFNHRDVISPTLLANYYGDNFDLSSISGGVWWKNEGLTDLDYTTVPGNTRDNVEEEHQFTQEFRFSSPKDRPIHLNDVLDLGWQGGVFAFSEDYQQSAANNTLIPNPFPSPIPTFIPLTQNSSADLDNWGVGVYGQAKLTAWEKLDFTAGLRFDYEDKHAELGNSLNPPFAPPGRVVASDNFSQFSPQFSLAYHFTTNHMAYASVARGFKAGGFNPPPTGFAAPPGTVEFGTEHSWNYEVGYKAQYFDGKVETTAALYYIDWRNLQLNQPIGLSGQYFIGNAGAADSKGVEFSALYHPYNWWDLFGSVGYNNAEFLSGSQNLGMNVGGNKLPYAPEYNANVGTQISWAPCTRATLYARAEVTVYGDFKYDATNIQGQSAYSLANFRAGVRGNHWFAEGWVNNAFDTHYVPIAIPYSTPSGYIGESGAPVTFGGRIGLTF